MRIGGLDHIGLAVSDRPAAERFYGEVLGLARDAEGRYRVGRTAFELLDTLSLPGPPARLGIHHLALAVTDLEQSARVAVEAGLLTSPEPRDGRVWLDQSATLGVRLCLVESADAGSAPATGADGMIERVDHVGIASADNVEAHRVFERLLGLPVESTQTDTEVRIPAEFFVSSKYGVAFNTRPAEAVGGLKVSFFTVGDCDLEVLQDYDPRTAGRASEIEGSTRGDQGAISRFVRTRGPGAHHIAIKVRDCDALLRRLESFGVDLIDREGRPGSRRARIAFLNPRATFGTLFHLVEREELA